MNILVIAAHPDDEVLGVGGAIIKYVQKGNNVYVAMITDGCSGVYEESKKGILKNSMEECRKILGVKEIFNLDFPNQKLDIVPLIEISQAIEKVIKKVNPEIVYMHNESDVNQDHRVIYNAGLIATRPIQPSKISEVLTYETLSSTEWNFGKSFLPNYFIDISSVIDKKIRAFSKYKTEVKEFPHPRSIEGIKTLAKYRGMQSGLQYAEAFKIIWKRVP